MSITLQVFLIVGIVLYFIFIISFLKRKALSLKYSLLWIITGIIMLVIAIFPQAMSWISEFLGIASLVNAVFALELFFQMVILMSITSVVSKQNEKTKKLVQSYAILEKRVREIEKQNMYAGEPDESLVYKSTL